MSYLHVFLLQLLLAETCILTEFESLGIDRGRLAEDC